MAAFWYGFAQGAEIILLPFILAYEWVTGQRFERLNK